MISKNHDDLTDLKTKMKVFCGIILVVISLIGIGSGISFTLFLRGIDVARDERMNNRDKTQLLEIKVATIQSDIQYIKESQTRQEANQTEIIKELRKLNNKKP